jgi:hypothetical protein
MLLNMALLLAKKSNSKNLTEILPFYYKFFSQQCNLYPYEEKIMDESGLCGIPNKARLMSPRILRKQEYR